VGILVAMSGGVDSSVAAALLVREHGPANVVGVTLKLWGGDSDSGCCSVADVDDARRVAQQLGIAHHVFNFEDDFDARVVNPYVEGHARGRTPNPCIECNRHIKFARLLVRARQLGFDLLATGHHARRTTTADGVHQLRRGADPTKDQSYVLAMLGQEQLARCVFPVGALTKSEVRRIAGEGRLRTATKPDSQDVCFIRSSEGHGGFLASRIELHDGRMVAHASGDDLGPVAGVEAVTVGQRRGMGHGPDGRRRYVTAVDVPGRRVVLGTPEEALTEQVEVEEVTWVAGGVAPLDLGGLACEAQCSAHGRPLPCRLEAGDGATLTVRFDRPARRVAPGQTVAFYDRGEPDVVLGSGIAR